MVRVRLLSICLSLLVSFVAAQAAIVTTVFSTGLRTNGAVVNEKGGFIKNDPHWEVATASNPSWTNAYLISRDGMPVNWLSNTPVSQWIGSHWSMIGFTNTGEFHYRTRFDLSGYNVSTVALHLAVASDDRVTAVLLNDQITGVTFTNGTSSWDLRDLTTGFLNGTNTLELVVTNAAGASGLNCQLSATDTPATLQITSGETNCVVSWTTNALCYVLESATNLSDGLWRTESNLPSIVNGQYQSIPFGGETSRYLRLKRPGSPSPTPKVLVNEAYGFGDGAEWVSFPDIPCSSQGCEISALAADTFNTLDASASTDWARCGTNDPTMQFHWKFFFPPESSMQGAPYDSPRPQGVDSPVVTFGANAFPGLIPTTMRWVARLDMISRVDPSVSKRVFFQFRYAGSEMTMTDYQNELTSE